MTATSQATSRQRAGRYTRLALLSVLPFVATLVFGPQSGMEALVIILPWALMIGAHVLFGIPAMVAAWRVPGSLLRVAVLGYFITFALAHLVYIAWANDLPRIVRTAWMHQTHAADMALVEALGTAVVDRDAVAAALASGARIDTVLPNGTTALAVATSRADPELLKQLLDSAARDGRGMRIDPGALHRALLGREYAMAGMLLDAGADPATDDADGRTPLCLLLTAHAGRELPTEALAILTRMLDMGADPTRRCGASYDAYTLALEYGWYDVIEAFVAAGKSLAAGRPYPLEQAISRLIAARQLDKLRLLLAAGASPDAASGYDLTARAIAEHDTELLSTLLDGGASARRAPYLFQAARRLDDPVDLVDALLAAGADPDQPGEGDMRPLAMAVVSGNPQVTRRLLEAGARPDLAHGYRDEPLLLALLRSSHRDASAEIMSVLLAAGANPNRPGNDGWTPLMIALDRREPDLARQLIDAGADVEARNVHGATALCLAMAGGRTDDVALLQQAGASDESCR